MTCGDLIGLKLGNLARSGVDYGLAFRVRLHHELIALLHAVAKRLAQHLQNELHRVVVVVQQDDVVRRHAPGCAFPRRFPATS